MFVKRFLILVIICMPFSKNVFAQKSEGYLSNWKKIDALEKKGLTASALKEVIIVFNMAASAGNDAQQIKASMYQMKYRNMIEEDNKENNIFFVDTLIAKAHGPAKNILLSMQAELFQNYRAANRYKLYDRTALVEENSLDISTWSAKKLNEKIAHLYLQSLQHETTLKTTTLEGFDAIIDQGKNTRKLRPTLFDFLAHRALDYFMQSENDVTQPAYKFILDDEKIFAPAQIFIATPFVTKDSNSLYFNALLLFQQLLKFHISDQTPEALIDIDLERLAFVNQHAVLTNKNEYYEAALKNIEISYSNNAASAQAMFLRAQLYRTNGEKYHPLTHKENQFDIQKAKLLCDSAISRFPKATGALNCRNLLIEINDPSLTLTTEKVNVPGQPFRSLVKYKNVSTVYFRAINVNHEDLMRIMAGEHIKTWQSTIALNAVKKWSVVLPDLKDFQEHSTEIKIDALPSGTFIILASMNADFSINDNLLARQITYVSNISFIKNSRDEMYVLDRDNGAPLANAAVQVWQQVYNSASRKYEQQKKEKYSADKNGYIKLKKQKDAYFNLYFQVNYQQDELFTDDAYYTYSYNSYRNKNKKSTFLFTDRSIYRPGQKVFFKGIVITQDGLSKTRVVAGYKATVILFDANRQKAGSVNLVSNEYGSFNGSFQLPDNLLNGQFHISDSANQSLQYFSVEEYKRPKFSVEITKPTGTYRINDSISIKGIAKAYAGNNIVDAGITFRVTRKVQYPPWWGWGRKIMIPYGNADEMEIANGITTSNSNGEFFILFKAIPDETVDRKGQPTFYYEVSADVTDLNGETRTGNTTVAVSYQALQLDIIAPESLPADSIHKIQISSTNTNDIHEKATVNLTIQKLQSPERIFRNRYWERPDQFIISKDEYVKSFPYDVYANEDEPANWLVLEKVIDITDTTSLDNIFNIRESHLTPGNYKMIATSKDKYGEQVRAEKYIRITGKAQQGFEAVTVEADNSNNAPGEKISYHINTGFQKIWVIHSVIKQDSVITTNIVMVGESKPFNNQVNIAEIDRGGINMSYGFVQHNRIYSGSKNFDIPWDTKDLKISYETFRDKLLPGAQETWKIRISGNKSEQVAAETLISMYDASLDQFKPHSWLSLKSVWPIYFNIITWASGNFSSTISEERDDTRKAYVKIPDLSYDGLISSGWNEGSYYGRYDEFARGGSRKSEAKMAMPSAMERSVSVMGNQAAAELSADSPNQIVADTVGEVDGKSEPKKENKPVNSSIQPRKNFNETAFFFPDLHTDARGNIEFSFTMPEALTRWKLMTLAHTKELASTYAEKTVITQKPLMVQPNAPRFLREGDRMEFAAKIVNLSDKEITGSAQLELFDAATNKPVDGWFKNIFPNQYFTVASRTKSCGKIPD